MDTVASRMSSPMDVTDRMDLNEIWKSSWMLVFFRFSCLERWVSDRSFCMFVRFVSRHRICSPLIIVNSTFIDVKNRRDAWWCGKKCSSRIVSLWKRPSVDRASCTSKRKRERERERRCFVLLGTSLVISIFMISRNSVDVFVNRWNNI